MRTFNIPDTVRYQITPHGNEVIFCLWELACPSEARESAFLFKVKQRLASQEAAQQLLRDYLEHFRVS